MDLKKMVFKSTTTFEFVVALSAIADFGERKV